MQKEDQPDSLSRKLVVFDDDPTGIQTVHDCKVITNWDEGVLEEALSDQQSFFYILTNIRAYPKERARQILVDSAQKVRRAAGRLGIEVDVLARSDSTLRSHFPLEVEVFADVFYPTKPVDAILVAPAFFESGRITVDDIHYVLEGNQRVQAEETEFALDPDFAYSTAHLPDYILEKYRAFGKDSRFDPSGREDGIRSISLELIRNQGVEAVAQLLRGVSDGRYVVVNAETYADLDVVTSAVRATIGEGRRFLFHTAASFVRSMMQQKEKMIDFSSYSGGPGVVIVGSYVARTARQLKQLLALTTVQGVPASVEEILSRPDQLEERTVAHMHSALKAGKSAVL
ncbi:MAG: four-carbon acid sugar kinase family protein, partial [Spirochaetota bacterium]|nr:four-carbon acid sugar kinase family protein [Spirochaetota bacterium]